MSGPDFGFLGQRAGFQIAEGWLTASADDSLAWLIAAGLLNTLTVLLLAGVGATLGGGLLGLARLWRQPLVRRLLDGLVDLLRNTPVLLQLFLWYSLLLKLPPLREAWHPLPGLWLSNRGLAVPALRLSEGGWGVSLEWPQLQGLGLGGGWLLSPELAALVWGLTVFHACHVSDIVRSAVLSVPLGPVQAARALGMRPITVARSVVLPLALRSIWPPYANQCLALLKNSTLALAIGYQDLMAILNTAITQTGRALEGMTLAGGFYLGLSGCLAASVAWHNQRANRQAWLAGSVARLSQWDGPLPLSARALWGRPGPALLNTVLLLGVVWLGVQSLRWALWDAVWLGPAAACDGAAGACWAVLAANHPLLLWGTVPAPQRLQAALACVGLLALAALWVLPASPRARQTRAWGSGLAVLWVAVVLGGGWPGAQPLPSADWGGLLVTLFLAEAALLMALPLAGLLAWARRGVGGRAAGLARGLALILIEAPRALPLVVQLLLVSFWGPLLWPEVGGSNKLWWALAVLVLHTAALLAEVLRGALQALPASQWQTALALGLRPHQAFVSIIWPQARRLAAPAALGVFVGAVKDTSLVMVIGLFDVLHAAKAVLADTGWRAHDLEVYGATAAFYLVLCWPLSALARRLARDAAAH